MPNIRIMPNNLVDSAVGLYASNALPTMGPANLQNVLRRSVVRADGNTLTLGFSYLVDQTANMFALCRSNCLGGTYTTWQLKLYANSDYTGTVRYDSTAVYMFNPTLNALDVFTDYDFLFLKNPALYFTTVTNFKSAQLIITDSSNTAPVEACRAYLGSYIELGYNPEWAGLEMSVDDLSVQGRTGGASLISSADERALRIPIKLGWVSVTDRPKLFALARRQGKTKDFYISVYPTLGNDLEVYHATGGKFTSVPSFNPRAVNWHQMSFEVGGI